MCHEEVGGGHVDGGGAVDKGCAERAASSCSLAHRPPKDFQEIRFIDTFIWINLY